MGCVSSSENPEMPEISEISKNSKYPIVVEGYPVKSLEAFPIEPVEGISVGEIVVNENKNTFKLTSIEKNKYVRDDKIRVIRSLTEPIVQHGVRRQNYYAYSSNFFVFPKNWVSPSSTWPRGLHNLSYGLAEIQLDKEESSDTIKLIHKNYCTDEDLMGLAEFIKKEKEKNRHEFVIETLPYKSDMKI